MNKARETFKAGLSQVEREATRISRAWLRRNPSLGEVDDLTQEGLIVFWLACQEDHAVDETVRLWSFRFRQKLTDLTRLSMAQKRSPAALLPEAALSQCSESPWDTVRLSMDLESIRARVGSLERRVIDCLLDPPEPLASSQRIGAGELSTFLGVSRCTIHRAVRRIREAA